MKAPLLDWLGSLLSRQKKPATVVIPTFPAVEIDPGLNDCCDVVGRLRGRRFLMTNAPPIPLPGCNMKKCNCRYARFKDRRQETRRGDDFGITNAMFTASDKREKSGGRRAEDQPVDEASQGSE